MLAGEDFVAHARDKFVSLTIEATAGTVCRSRSPLQDGIGGDHLTRHQILADAEVLERALRLRAPQFVSRHLDATHAVGFDSDIDHDRYLHYVSYAIVRCSMQLHAG